VGEWRLPVLNSICTHPTLRADDSLIVNDGYDSASRILIDMQGVDFGTIKEHPMEDEAREALSTLKAVLAEFPFVPDDPAIPVGTLGARSSSRSVALSSILTAVSRRTMRNAPMHAYDAPEASSGKTLLANIAANIATGLDAPPVTYTGDSDEEKKTLLSLLRTGTAAILYDNVDLPFENASLCSALTEPTWGCRLLGVNELPTVLTNSLFSLTGNNVRLRGDMVSRSIKARINSGLENPQERKFRRVLDAYVREHRPELVRAALTVLRWNVSAGYPGLQHLSGTRFADWTRRVRSALVALGEPDPIETQKNIRVVDPAKTTLGALLAIIATHMGVGTEFSPSEVLAKVNSHLDLRDAVTAALPKGVGPQALGYYLDKHADQVVCGMVLSQSYSKKFKANRYQVNNATGLALESGPQDLFA
jgi:putative DNA primase/helicase